MRIVLDTNVLVSAVINPEGTPAKILRLLLNGKLILLYDARLLREYSDVLYRRKFGFRKSWISPVLDYFGSEGEYINADPVGSSFPDEDDKAFYEVAKSGNARYLINGNKNHFPDEDLVVSPKEFLERYMKHEKSAD